MRKPGASTNWRGASSSATLRSSRLYPAGGFAPAPKNTKNISIFNHLDRRLTLPKINAAATPL
jgi:hypothetical protein